jgi:hypothetical protein
VPQVLNVLLSHQRPPDFALLLQYWRAVMGDVHILLVYGGSADHFEHIAHEPKLFVADPRLRTRDHQREHQSITSLIRMVSAWMSTAASHFDFVYLAEYDHLPLVQDLNERQVARLQSERADLLGFNLHRIDGTSHPHYLYHSADPRFEQWLNDVSVRSDKSVTLSMLGTGSFWSRDCFDAVAAFEEPHAMYFEIYLPTLAHHLGFRARDWTEQNAFVSNKGDRWREIESARAAGAWTLHPVKSTLSEAITGRSPGVQRQPG